jgi:transcriptional regulator with XRE-family HTH domain
MNRLGPQFADIITKQLEAKGWSQADLAREMGVTPKHINQMLTGKATGSPGMLDFAAFTLGFEWSVMASEITPEADHER